MVSARYSANKIELIFIPSPFISSLMPAPNPFDLESGLLQTQLCVQIKYDAQKNNSFGFVYFIEKACTILSNRFFVDENLLFVDWSLFNSGLPFRLLSSPEFISGYIF